MYTIKGHIVHHQVEGAHWGVHNGPPYPLSREISTGKKLKENAKKPKLTKEQKVSIKRLKKAAKTKHKVDDIVNTLSIKDKKLLAMDPKSKEWLTINEGEHVIKRVVKEVGKVPVSFFDLLDDGEEIQLALATRSGDQYRGKGYASDAAKQAMEWLNKHPKERNGRDVIWGVREDNQASINIAKKLGFVEDPDSHNDGWVNYINKGNKVFVSGSSKTQDETNEFYRKKLPKEITKELNKSIKNRDKILVGDAPGIDRQVQDYLKKKKYDNVEIYGPGKQVRYKADDKWKDTAVDDPDHEPMSGEWLAKKDKAMSDRATRGIAVTIKGGAAATRNNVERMVNDMKDVKVYELDNNKKLDRWLNSDEIKRIKL